MREQATLHCIKLKNSWVKTRGFFLPTGAGENSSLMFEMGSKRWFFHSACDVNGRTRGKKHVASPYELDYNILLLFDWWAQISFCLCLPDNAIPTCIDAKKRYFTCGNKWTLILTYLHVVPIYLVVHLTRFVNMLWSTLFNLMSSLRPLHCPSLTQKPNSSLSFC